MNRIRQIALELRQLRLPNPRASQEEEQTRLAEIATIKKKQHSAHQRHYWLPPGRTGAERLKAFYAVAAPVDEAKVLDTVKAAMAKLPHNCEKHFFIVSQELELHKTLKAR